MFRAAFVVALVIGRIDFALCLVLGFCCGLRPSEIYNLARYDIILPSDLGNDDGIVFIVIRKPKTAKRGARVQHVLLEEVGVVRFVAWAVGRLESETRIWPRSAYYFVRCWDEVFGSVLRLTVHGDAALTPASLRAGAATEVYKQTRDLSKVRWMLRHQDEGTLEHYIQELPAALARARLCSASAAHVQLFAPHATEALAVASSGIFGPSLASPLAFVPPCFPREASPKPKKRQRNIEFIIPSPGGLNGEYWKIR